MSSCPWPVALAFAALAAGAPGCGAAVPKPWDLEDHDAQKLVCSDSGHDVLGLQQSQRATLTQLAKSGIVAVRYSERGCNVELELLDCFMEGTYDYTGLSNEDHKTAYRAGDLWAQIPLGAARLGMGLQEGEALKKDVMMVGLKALPPDAPLGALKGRECGKANYLVKKLYVGGFAIHRGSKETLDANATFFGRGAGTSLAQGVQRHDGDGDLTACLAAASSGQPNGQCAAPLKIELLLIPGRSAAGPPPESNQALPRPPPSRPEARVEAPPALPVQPPPARPEAPSLPPPPPPAPATEAGMVRVPGGSFLMGAGDLSGDERPPHQVSVGPFSMDRTEVTVAAYGECVSQNKCTTEGLTSDCNWGRADRASHPINCVDWNQAVAYCSFRGKRLPTEREWEFAARGPDSRKYPWGQAEPSNQLCWNGPGNDLGAWKRESTCPVGQYPSGASPFGALDMAGNVWEWTSSGFCKPESNSCADAARVVRGGSWDVGVPGIARGALRGGFAPAYRDIKVGIRCARP